MNAFLWILLGIVTVLLFQALRRYLQGKNLRPLWYFWLATAAWYALLVLSVDMVGLSIYEDETRAAWIMGVALGIICVLIVPILRALSKAGMQAKEVGR